MLSNSKQGGVTWNYTNCAMWMATKHGSPIILKNNGGDDWDDAPYEHNAGEPYNYWSELIEDNEDIFKRKYKHHEIKHKVLYFETESNMILPCDNYLNSPYSVEDINKQAVAWIHTDDFNILAGTTIENFIDILERHGGKVFLPKEE